MRLAHPTTRQTRSLGTGASASSRQARQLRSTRCGQLTITSATTIGLTADGASAASYAVQSGRWQVPDVPQNKFSRNADWTNIEFLRIGIQDTSGNPTDCSSTAWISSSGTPLEKPKWHGGQHRRRLAPYVVHRAPPGAPARRWKCTLMPIPGAHGTDSKIFLTDAQAQELHDIYGWEVGAHCSKCPPSQGTPEPDTDSAHFGV